MAYSLVCFLFHIPGSFHQSTLGGGELGHMPCINGNDPDSIPGIVWPPKYLWVWPYWFLVTDSDLGNPKNGIFGPSH